MVSDISCNADGNRLDLNWNEAGLNCDNWNDDDKANDNIGAFVLMMGKEKRHPFLGCLCVWSRNTLHPSAEHAPDGCEFSGKLPVFVRIQRLCFPQQCEKKFQLVQFTT